MSQRYAIFPYIPNVFRFFFGIIIFFNNFAPITIILAVFCTWKSLLFHLSTSRLNDNR